MPTNIHDIDQQRLLAGAKVDSKAAQEVKNARTVSQRPGDRATRKRKESAATNGTDEEGSKIKDESDIETDTEVLPTPQRSDDDDEDDAAFEAGLPTREQQRDANRNTQQAPASPPPTTLPPRRELPFGQKNGTTMIPPKDTPMQDAANGVEADDGTDTDDEL